MSIDADLNAGIITEQEARTRRQTLEREADFYGAMDGAIRFVRGDAIAGILITLINIIGGFSIGVFQQSMEVSQAAQVYTLLTIGDGLVSQLPALTVSTAAGLVVTRAVSDKNLPFELLGQLLNQPFAFVIASVSLFFFGLIPGLPHLPFFLLGTAAGAIAYYRFDDLKRQEVQDIRKREEEAKAPVAERVESILPLDVMELEVGYELIPLVDADRNGELLDRIKSIRRQFALEMGFIVPPLHIRDKPAAQIQRLRHRHQRRRGGPRRDHDGPVDGHEPGQHRKAAGRHPHSGTDVRPARGVDPLQRQAGSADGGLHRGRSPRRSSPPTSRRPSSATPTNWWAARKRRR